MPVTIYTQRTTRFIDLFPYIALGSTVLVCLALIVSPFFSKTLVTNQVEVEPEETEAIKTLQLQPQPVGALLIDVKALLPLNQWVTFEIQIRDGEQIIASAVKQAWRESGTWYEDGESGTWQEQDLLGELAVRSQNSETFTIAISVLEYGETSGQELATAVPFEVTVQSGVVDRRYLWAGLVGTASLTVIGFLAAPLAGKKAIDKTINDSDPQDRATVGGLNRLVRVIVKVIADETSPRQLDVRLSLNDAYGEQIYAQSFPLTLDYKKEDGKVESATGNLQAFFILEPHTSYGFQVEVTPDAPVDLTSLTVRDGNRTRKGVEVVRISLS